MKPLSEVFAEIKEESKKNRRFAFSIQYVRQDSTAGFKARVCKVFVGEENALFNRTVCFHNYENGDTFKIGLDFWIQYNGQQIDHTK
jgi:hypothetical protein